jgi:tetratricopeptide (TPR) repeat protein
VVAGSVLVVLIVLAIGIWSLRIRQPPLDPNLVAVALFENRTGDPALDGLSQQVTERITRGLVESGVARAVSAMAVPDHDRGPTGNGSSQAALNELARSTGAGLIVRGSYDLEGDAVRLQAHVFDACRGEPMYECPMLAGPRDATSELIDALSERVMGAIAAELDFYVHSPRLVPPPLYSAYREYRAGRECREIVFATPDMCEDVDRVRSYFHRAIEIDSTFASPWFALYLLYEGLGQYAAVDSVLRHLENRRDELVPVHRLHLEIARARLDGKLHRWLESARELCELEPDLPWGRISLGLAARGVNRPREALEAFEGIEPAAWHDRIIGLCGLGQTCQCYDTLGEYEEELAAVARFIEYYPGDEFGRGWYRVQALAGLGRLEEIDRTIDECLTLEWAERNPSWMLLTTSRALRKHGYRVEALSVARRAVELYRNRPDEATTSEVHRWQLAKCLYHAERWDEAEALCAELVAAHPTRIAYLGRLGTSTARRGEIEEARRILHTLRGDDRPYLMGEHTAWCARIAALLGEREFAMELLIEATAQGKPFVEHWPYYDIDLEGLRGYPQFDEFVRPKG